MTDNEALQEIVTILRDLDARIERLEKNTITRESLVASLNEANEKLATRNTADRPAFEG